MTMQALLIIAHGSRRPDSNDEIRAMTERVRALVDARYARIECAFLELAAPSIDDAIEALIADGAQRIAALPYFLAAGRHVREDVPAEIEAKRRAHPGVEIELLPYLGTAPGMPELLADMLDRPRAEAQPV